MSKAQPDSRIQQIFDRVATHLLTQNACSYDEDRDMCMYRGPEGRKCAVGFLIADEHYSQDLEMRPVHEEPVLHALQKSLGHELTLEENLLLETLQSTHDENSPKAWPTRLQSIAKKFGLRFTKVPQVMPV